MNSESGFSLWFEEEEGGGGRGGGQEEEEEEEEKTWYGSPRYGRRGWLEVHWR